MCPVGTYSVGGAAVCTPCASGFTSAPGSSYCYDPAVSSTGSSGSSGSTSASPGFATTLNSIGLTLFADGRLPLAASSVTNNAEVSLAAQTAPSTYCSNDTNIMPIQGLFSGFQVGDGSASYQATAFIR